MLEVVPITDIPPSFYSSYSCGVDELDEYLHRYAKGNHKKGIGKSFLLVQNDKVVGYYTISMGEVQHHSLPADAQTGIPRYPVPVARIGRLSVDITAKGQGLGKFLLVDALQRAWDVAQMVAAYAVVVDAKGPDSKAFYEHFGFAPFADEPMSLVLPFKALASLFKNRS